MPFIVVQIKFSQNIGVRSVIDKKVNWTQPKRSKFNFQLLNPNFLSQSHHCEVKHYTNHQYLRCVRDHHRV